jgi:hypothetical protein
MPTRRQYAGPSAVKRAVQAAVAALRAEGLQLDVAGISFSPDGGVTVLTGKAPPPGQKGGSDDGWGDFT